MKKVLRIFIISLFAALFCSITAQAETLDEFEKQLISYQRDPYDRAMELQKLLYNTFDNEDSLSKQMNLPITDILAYENSIEKAMNYYLSVRYFEKQDSTNDTTVIDQSTLQELVRQEPPYTLTYYLELIDNIEKCNSVVKERETYLEHYKKGINRTRRERDNIEKEFRLYADRVNSGIGNQLQAGWKLEIAKQKLETNFIEEHFYHIATVSRESSINELRAKTSVMDELLKKVRKNLQVTNDDYKNLDNRLDQKAADFTETINELNTRYDTISDKLKTETKPTPFTKFCYSTEQNIIEDEVLILLNVGENWASLRKLWHTLHDINSGKMKKHEIQEFRQYLESFIKNSERDVRYCVTNLAKINTSLRTAEGLFGKDSITLSPADIQLRTDFTASLEEHKRHYMTFLFDILAIRARYKDVLNEVNYTLSGTEITFTDRVSSVWDHIVDLRDFELWHIEDYPVTLGRLLTALLIFAIGCIIAHGIKLLVLHRLRKHGIEITHNILIIIGCIKYFLIIIAFLVALSSLKIPFTAFAFAGGAIAVAFGFGAQKVMADIFSGVLLLVKNRIHVGDHIMLNGQYGIVKEITLHDTVIITEDSKHVMIPNGKFFDYEFINLTLTSPVIRTDIQVGIAYNSDVEKANKVILEVLDNSKYVIKKPYRRVLFNTFADSSIGFDIQFFMDIQKHSQFAVRSSVRQEILEAFRQNDIQIAYPQLDVHIDDQSK